MRDVVAAKKAVPDAHTCNTNHPIESLEHGINSPFAGTVSRAEGTFDETANTNPPPPFHRYPA